MIVPRYYEDIQILHDHTMPVRAYYIPASVRMDDLAEHREHSDRLQLLNGRWRFRYFESIYDLKEAFYQTEYDCSGFDEIAVPGTWQMAGYDLNDPAKMVYHSTAEKAIRFNLDETATDVRGAYRSLFHEMGHNIDYLLGDVSCTRNFRNTLINDFGTVVNNYMKMYNCDIQTAYFEIGRKIEDDKFHSVSDLADIITYGMCRGKYRHQDDYRGKKNVLEMEAFAHFFEAYTRNDAEKLEALEEIFPNAINLFYKMIGGK